MSERITEKSMRSMDHYARKVLKTFKNIDIDTVAVSTRILVAEVRRLRGLLMLAIEEGEDMRGNLPPEVEAEAEAIRAEEGK